MRWGFLLHLKRTYIPRINVLNEYLPSNHSVNWNFTNLTLAVLFNYHHIALLTVNNEQKGEIIVASVKKIKANNKQGYKWFCIADGPPDPETGKRNQISRRADKKQDAINLVEKAIRKLQEDGIDGKKVRTMTFEKVAWEWLIAYSRNGKKESTIDVRKKQINILLRYISKVNIDKVTSRMHQKILNDLDDQGYVKTSIEGVNVTAGMIFKYVLHEKMRKDNPCAGAIIPVKILTVEDIENDDIEEKYLEREELFEFLQIVREHGLKYDLECFYLLAFSEWKFCFLYRYWTSSCDVYYF
jgi:hypothetical protein